MADWILLGVLYAAVFATSLFASVNWMPCVERTLARVVACLSGVVLVACLLMACLQN